MRLLCGHGYLAGLARSWRVWVRTVQNLAAQKLQAFVPIALPT